jgi:hypothetical protein
VWTWYETIIYGIAVTSGSWIAFLEMVTYFFPFMWKKKKKLASCKQSKKCLFWTWKLNKCKPMQNWKHFSELRRYQTRITKNLTENCPFFGILWLQFGRYLVRNSSRTGCPYRCDFWFVSVSPCECAYETRAQLLLSPVRTGCVCVPAQIPPFQSFCYHCIMIVSCNLETTHGHILRFLYVYF